MLYYYAIQPPNASDCARVISKNGVVNANATSGSKDTGKEE